MTTTRATNALLHTHLPTTGLRLDVYRGRYDGTAGGLTAAHRFDELLLVDRSTALYDAVCSPNAVELNVRVIGAPILSLEPVTPTLQRTPVSPVLRIDQHRAVGPMFGGHYAASSDSRLSAEIERLLALNGSPDSRFYGALAVHDRYETVSDYDSYSR